MPCLNFGRNVDYLAQCFVNSSNPPPKKKRKCPDGISNRGTNASVHTLSIPPSAIIKLSEAAFLETLRALLNKLHKRRQDVFSHPYLSPSNMKHDLSVGSLPNSTEHRICDLRKFVLRYGRFGTIYRSTLQGASRPFKMKQIGCTETSVTNYQSRLPEITKSFFKVW